MAAICLNKNGCKSCNYNVIDTKSEHENICMAQPNRLGFVGRDDLTEQQQILLYMEQRKHV